MSSSLAVDLRRPDRLAFIAGKLVEYETLIKAAEPLFSLEGRNLVDITKEHAQNLENYALILVECRAIENFLRLEMERVEGSVYRRYIESNARALGVTEMKHYVRSDPEYTNAAQALLDVQYIREQLHEIVEAFRTQGWDLSNIVKVKVANLDIVL